MPFAGRNHLFLRLNKFFHIFPSQTEKRKKKERKATQKHAQNCTFGCQPVFKGNTYKLVDPPCMHVFQCYFGAFLSFFFFSSIVDGKKTCFNAETNVFDQQTALLVKIQNKIAFNKNVRK